MLHEVILCPFSHHLLSEAHTQRVVYTVKSVLRDRSRGQIMWSLETGDFLMQVNSSVNCASGGLEGHNTGGL